MLLKRVLAVVAIIGLVVLLWVVWDQEAVMHWMGSAGPVPFFAAMVVLPALGAPLTPFFVVAGATFGAFLGAAGSLIALALNLMLCYRLARGRFRPRLESLLRRFDYDLPDFEASGKSALRFTLLVKFAPGIPGFVKHYGLGVAGVPFALYLSSAMLISGAYGLLLVVLGESLVEHELEMGAGAVAMVLVSGGGLWWWRKRAAKSESRVRATATPGGRHVL